MLGLRAAIKLPLSFDPVRLARDVEALSGLSFATHTGPYHDGGWRGVGLIAHDGDMRDVSGARLPDQGSGRRSVKKTEAIKLCPYIEEVIDSFQCDKLDVRVLTLGPGQCIYEHRDLRESVDFGCARVHIPIVTDDRVISVIARKRHHWQPGEVWYGDYTFPHWVRNPTEIMRVHLVLDLVVNDWVRALFPTHYLALKQLRAIWRWYHFKMYWYLPEFRKGVGGL